jgi:hypothetical protein
MAMAIRTSQLSLSVQQQAGLLTKCSAGSKQCSSGRGCCVTWAGWCKLAKATAVRSAAARQCSGCSDGACSLAAFPRQHDGGAAQQNMQPGAVQRHS